MADKDRDWVTALLTSGRTMIQPSKPDTAIVFPAIPDGVARLDPAGATHNPLELLQQWVSYILDIGALEPMYVTLATTSADGVPSSRTVQLLDVEADALLFTTNIGSRKGVEMRQTGRAAVSIYWRETAQSVNLTGAVVEADDEENDRRFAEEVRQTQASRTVSFHGRPLLDEQEQLRAFFALRDSDVAIPRPAYWKWFRVVPDAVTFWEGHADALNRRLHYRRQDGAWHRAMIQA
jgi:pyridoxamine 5'-phosphate oxidase